VNEALYIGGILLSGKHILMKNYCTALFLSIFTFAFLLSCKKDNEKIPLKDPEFYYVGYSYQQRPQDANSKRAIMSIGDSIVKLSPNNRSEAVAIHVYGDDVYTTGYQYNGDTRRVVYWKNNEIRRLGDAYPYNGGTAIFADGSGVYVAGTVYEMIEGRTLPFQHVWVNDTFLQKSGALAFSGIFALLPYQDTLYMAGDFGQQAQLWTDGIMRGLAGSGSGARALNVVNGEVYVLGFEVVNSNTDAISVWKYRRNGVRPEKVFSHELGKRITKMDAAMYGNDYYFVVNSSNGNSSVHKNNQLLYSLSETGNVEAQAIQVYQGKVYVLGQQIDGTAATPTLWIDGEPQTLFDADQKIYLHDFFIK